MNAVLQMALEQTASDIHIVVGAPVQLRVNGTLVPVGEAPVTPEQAQAFITEILPAEAVASLKEKREVDGSAQMGETRLRVNCHYERGNVSLVARIIATEIPTPEEIGLAEVSQMLDHTHEGLVLFTGPTGQGKSTSLAALIRHINETRALNIVTLEDPIEFLFPHGKGIMRQRQYMEDFLSFPEALKHILRQDPDIVMVGEMRDPETIAAALTLAETGHLIFATLHTPNTVQTIDRIIDVFPPHQQNQIRSQLSLSLRMVVAQRLLPKEGGGRIAQREVLVNTIAVANTIREGRLQELKSTIQSGADDGMVTFEKSAEKLLKDKRISKDIYEWAVEGA